MSLSARTFFVREFRLPPDPLFPRPQDRLLTVDELWNSHEQLIGTHAHRKHGTTPPHMLQDALDKRHHAHDHDGDEKTAHSARTGDGDTHDEL
jgi:hypothetical protein